MKTCIFGCLALVSVLTAPCGAPAAEPVALGTAGDFAILAGSAITSTDGGSVDGNVGLSPTTGAAITGLAATNVNGFIYTVDTAGPSGSVQDAARLTAAKNDLTAAFTNTAALPVDSTVGTELGGTTNAPGVYDSASGTFGITGILTLDGGGDPDAVFIFKMATTLTTAASSEVVLMNGAHARNVFWLVGSSATLGATSIFKGIIMADQSITMESGSVIEGRMLASAGQVTFDSQRIVEPPTLAVISAVWSRVENGVAVISWEVALELGTAGYFLERWAGGVWLRVNSDLLPSQYFAQPPLTYSQADATAPPGTTQRYRIVELDHQGRLLPYGPYDLELDGGEISFATWSAGMTWDGADADADADPDGDGLTNFQEYLAGTNPLSANSVLRISAMRNETAVDVVIAWLSVSNKLYALELSADLTGGFTPFVVGIAATPPLNTHTVAVDRAIVSTMYFRVIVQ